MVTLELETDDVSSDIYLSLGLKDLDKGVGVPRVLSLLSSLLERSVQKNEMLVETEHIEDVVTVFHGLSAPTLSLRKYIDRIFKYSGCSPSCFVVAHIYVDRLLQNTEIKLTSLNVHRLLITSIMLAAKFMDDAFFNNAYYARVGGVKTCELNRLEMSFLFGIDFRLQVSVDTFHKYCWQLEEEGLETLQIERPMQACRIKESWSNKDDPSCASTIARW
ncbi:putative cyclin [Medicago truncatula]|nr:cyclin-P3-1 [Medicago truncatula]AFK40409.1 unknown [Medicago truncatula]KEH23761.1 cyclin p4 [Medicago truncatula]RHN48074.1 putative cyclin [Medicago truncatula]